MDSSKPQTRAHDKFLHRLIQTVAVDVLPLDHDGDSRDCCLRLHAKVPLMKKTPVLVSDVAPYDVYFDGGLTCDTDGLPFLPLLFSNHSPDVLVGFVLKPIGADGEFQRIRFFFLVYLKKPGLLRPSHLKSRRVSDQQRIDNDSDIPRA